VRRTAETLAMVNIYRALAGAPGDATPIASAND
jgi:multidrug efflux system outer membrane protein